MSSAAICIPINPDLSKDTHMRDSPSTTPVVSPSPSPLPSPKDAPAGSLVNGSPQLLGTSPLDRPPKLSRQLTSFIFNETTHTFSVILPDKPTWEVAIQHHFPGSIREEAFVKRTYKALNDLDFHNHNTLSCVSLCRDEMCSPFLEEIDNMWKAPFMNIKDEIGKAETLYTHSFCLSSLAGMLFLGVTGMKAAVSHAPIDHNGRQKFVFFAFPHIGISEKGVLGEVERPGHVSKPSAACGAIVQFWTELANNDLHLETDPTDIEYSLLKQRLLKRIPLFTSQVPTVKQLTYLTYSTIVEDLEKLISQVVNPAEADYAVLTGIQVHSPGGASYIWEGEQYTVINGVKQELIV